jgi:hypothetical protein
MVSESGRLDHIHIRAALALHKTMHGLRLPVSEIPLDQRILRIHIGA